MTREYYKPTIAISSLIFTAGTRSQVAEADVRAFLSASFERVGDIIRSCGIEPGPAFCLYHGVPGSSPDIEVGFVVPHPISGGPGLLPGSLPASRLVRLVHTGDFEDRGDSWDAIMYWMEEQSITPAWQRMWEFYRPYPKPGSDPTETELNWPIS